jgi:hypothetical protein
MEAFRVRYQDSHPSDRRLRISQHASRLERAAEQTPTGIVIALRTRVSWLMPLSRGRANRMVAPHDRQGCVLICFAMAFTST